MSEEGPTLDEIAQALTFSQLTPQQWKLWKAEMRRAPQWFVLGRPGWGNERWRALAGPFNNPQEAQRAADSYADDGMRDGHLDLQCVYTTQVKSLTETVRMFRNNLMQIAEDLDSAESGGEVVPLPTPSDEDQTPASLAS